MSTLEPIPGTRAVQRALSLLKVFSDEKPRWSLTDLSNEVGLSKPTAHRMLAVLEKEGFVTRPHGSSEFQLGPEMIVLGVLALNAVDIRAVARPELKNLAATTGEDASLETLVGSEVLILDEERGQGLMGLGTEVGTRWPAHATATGKVLLANAEDPMPEPPGGLQPVTSKTITSWKEWTESLEVVRNQGFATNIEELEYGYLSVAAPIHDREGRTTASLSVGGSAHRVSEERIPELAEAVRAAAFRVSQHLGFRG